MNESNNANTEKSRANRDVILVKRKADAARRAKKKKNTPNKKRRAFEDNLSLVLTEVTGIQHNVVHKKTIKEGLEDARRESKGR